MNHLVEELRLAVAAFRGGTCSEDTLYALVHRVGHEDGVKASAQPIVESLLNAPAPPIRDIALQVLTIMWQCQEHRPTCERILEQDVDDDVRRAAVFGLISLLEGTRDPLALRILLRTFCDEDQDAVLRDSAYTAVLAVLGRPLSEWPPGTRLLDHVRDVNWELVREAEAIARSG
jgi:hypothetical protein